MRKQNKKHRKARKHKAGPVAGEKRAGLENGGKQRKQKLAPNFTGQHLLHNPGTIGRLIDAARLKKSDTVLELGAGKGHLTFAIAERAGKVIAVEIDTGYVQMLRIKADGNPRILIVQEDIRVMRLPRGPFCVVANIPFSITTPIMEKLLGQEGASFQRGALIMENGAAARFTQNPPRDPRVILWHMYFKLEKAAVVSRTHFAPPPRVDAAIVSIYRREKPLIMLGKEKLFLAFARHLLREPRQISGYALRDIFTPEQLKRILRKNGVDREQSMISLSLEQWAGLFTSMLEHVMPCRWPKR
jgi:23S rRNA (adenine-N6)-dimethyltransferase